MSLPSKFVAVDTETTGVEPWAGSRVFAASAVDQNGRVMFWRDRCPPELKDILGDPGIDKVFHNAVFDCMMCRHSGMPVRGRVWDTMILGRLADGTATQKMLSLDYMMRRYLPPKWTKVTTEIVDWFRENGYTKARWDFSKLPNEMLKRRVEMDTKGTFLLFKKLFPPMMQRFPFLMDQEHRLLPIVEGMVDRGVMLDLEELDRQARDYDAKIDEVQEFFDCLTDEEMYNYQSPVKLKQLLIKHNIYQHMPVDPVKGRKVLSDPYLKLIPHPIPQFVTIGKGVSKMRATFIDQMMRRAHNGVLHPGWDQTGTKTGRFACRGPNLMNIPIEGDRRATYTAEEADLNLELTGITYAPHIKRLFKCRPGYVHIHSDKSRVEVGVLAHYINDKTLNEILRNGLDIHGELARRIFSDYNDGLRTQVKRLVFGRMYGAGLKNIAARIGIPESDVRLVNTRLEQLLPGLPRWRRRLAQGIEDRGFVETVHGRRHPLTVREAYKAVNRLCQGTAGDEVKSRMVALQDYFNAEGLEATILLNIHDDIGMEILEEQCTVNVIRDIHRIMEETSIEYVVPLAASLEWTNTCWGDKKKVSTETYNPYE